MKLFVTGGTGFVGSHLINAAHRAGHEVRALRRTGSTPRVALEREPEWVEGALDGDHSAALVGVDALVHLASHTPNPPYDTFGRCLYWNVQSSIGLAEQAVSAGVTRMLVAGTCFEYGRTADRVNNLSPADPLEPFVSYPASKAVATVAFAALARERGLRLIVARIFQVYGEGERGSRMWPSLRAAAQAGRDFPMSPGLQVRDFIEVGDVASRLVRALAFDGVEAGVPIVRHVATGRPETLLAFAQRWWGEWGATGRLIPGAVPMRATETMRIASDAACLLR